MTDTRRRVKLYALNADCQWDDRGTGHVSSNYVDRLKGISLIVRAEADGSLLLESKIQPVTAYQKQKDTLIVWSEGDNFDLALSFQEKAGCDEIWEKICQVTLVLLMFRDWWDEYDREKPSRLMHQHCGLWLRRYDLWNSYASSALRPAGGYFRPWLAQLARSNSGTSSLIAEPDKVQVILDVRQFSPNEITVNTIENTVVVEVKHEEKQDEHSISCHFIRKYLLPKDVEVNNITSSLSSDGVLTISAPKKVKEISKMSDDGTTVEKKGRGRPKASVDDTKVAKKREWAAADKSPAKDSPKKDNGEVPAKRGRGRTTKKPKVKEISKISDDGTTVEKKGRSRPKASVDDTKVAKKREWAAADKSPAKDSPKKDNGEVPAKRGRGRTTKKPKKPTKSDGKKMDIHLNPYVRLERLEDQPNKAHVKTTHQPEMPTKSNGKKMDIHLNPYVRLERLEDQPNKAHVKTTHQPEPDDSRRVPRSAEADKKPTFTAPEEF